MGDITAPRLLAGTSKPILGLVKMAMSMAVAKGDPLHALSLAQSRFPHDQRVHSVLKSAITSGATTGTWGGSLWDYQTIATEFLEALRPLSIVARLQGVRSVPFMIRAPRVTASSSVGWVGQGAPKAVGELAFDEITMGRAKCAGIIAISVELARSSEPSAAQVVQQDMLSSVASFVDQQFISPSNIASVGVHPGSIFSGVSGIASSGTTAAAIAVDLAAAVTALVAGGSSLLSPVWVLHPRTAIAIALKRDTAGGPAYPGVTINGGMLAGIPVLVSGNVPWSASGGGLVGLIDQSEIVLADGGLELDGSGEASLQMLDVPSANAAAQVSLWQNNLFALKCEREINWLPKHSAAATASWIDGAAY